MPNQINVQRVKPISMEPRKSPKGFEGVLDLEWKSGIRKKDPKGWRTAQRKAYVSNKTNLICQSG